MDTPPPFLDLRPNGDFKFLHPLSGNEIHPDDMQDQSFIVVGSDAQRVIEALQAVPRKERSA